MEILNWKELLNPYEQAVTELKLKFENAMNEYKTLGLYSPIESVSGRVKKPASIMDKAKKKNIPNNKIEEEIEEMLSYLNERDKDLFRKYYLENFDLEEIAMDTNTQVSNLYNRLSRGRKKIKENCMKKEV